MRAQRRGGTARGKGGGDFHWGQKSRILRPTPTPAPQEEAGSPLPQVRTATLRESCTSPAAGPRPTSPGRGPLGGGKPVPGSRPRLRVAQPVGSQKVTLQRPQGTRGQGTQAGEQVSAAHAPEMSAPGSGPGDRAAPRSSARALPYLPLGPQQAEKLPAPAQQHPRHLDGKRTSARTCALGTAAPRAEALLEAGGSRSRRRGRGGDGVWRPCWKWARRRHGPHSWRVKSHLSG